MNFLPAQVLGGNGRQVAIDGDVSMAVELSHLRVPLSEGMTVILGIRPQHLRLAAEGVLRLRPDVVEQLGDVGYLYGQTPAGTTLVAQTADRIAANDTSEVRLGFDPAAVFVFARDGSRLR